MSKLHEFEIRRDGDGNAGIYSRSGAKPLAVFVAGAEELQRDLQQVFTTHALFTSAVKAEVVPRQHLNNFGGRLIHPQEGNA